MGIVGAGHRQGHHSRGQGRDHLPSVAFATVVRKRQQIARSAPENPPSSFLRRSSPPRARRATMQPRSATARSRVPGKRNLCLYRAPGPQG